LASPFRDFNCASDVGKDASPAVALGAAASECEAAAIPAVAPPNSKNRRREIMSSSQ
jgi:hypothetical protein